MAPSRESHHDTGTTSTRQHHDMNLRPAQQAELMDIIETRING